MTPEAVTSVITFILNSALLSSFIIPQVQKLKEMKDQLFKFKLPHAPSSGTVRTVTREQIDELTNPDQEAQRLQSILDSYRVRSNELKATVNKFYGSVLLAAAALITSAIWPDQTNFILSIHPILQLGILLWAIKSYSTDPDRLSSPVYLVKDCEINPHVLIEAMGLNITFDSGLGLGQKQEWDHPLNINLSLKLRLYGFRFFFIIADQDGKVYYVSFGPVTPETKLWRHILHPAWGIPEINRVEIGKFKFNKFQTGKSLQGWFLLFLPIFKHEKLNPMLALMTIDVPGRASGNMLASSGSAATVASDKTYAGVSYRGEGADVSDVAVEDVAQGNNPVINKVVQKFHNDFLRAGKIKQLEDDNGLLA